MGSTPYLSRSFAAQFNTGRRPIDSGALSMVHHERSQPVVASNSTKMLNPVPGTWPPAMSLRPISKFKRKSYHTPSPSWTSPVGCCTKPLCMVDWNKGEAATHPSKQGHLLWVAVWWDCLGHTQQVSQLVCPALTMPAGGTKVL